jgi:hypothetical protein
MAGAKDDDDSLQDPEGSAGTIVMSDHEGRSGTVVMGQEADPQAPIDPRLARMRAIQQAGAGRAVKARPAPAAASAPRSPGQPVFGGAAADNTPSPPNDVDPMGGTVAIVDEPPMGGTVAMMDEHPMAGTVAVVDTADPVYPVPPPPPPPGALPPGPPLPHGGPPSVVQPAPARRTSPMVIVLLVVGGLLAVGAALFHFMRS